MEFNHIPVMPTEIIEGLGLNHQSTTSNPIPGLPKVYVDGTLGGGGHSKLILDTLPKGSRLIGIDRDKNAINAATNHISNDMFTPVHGNFHDIPQILENLNITAVNGILLDLGVSSHQLDTAERGFSYRFDGPLDMRMNQESHLSAYEIVNSYAEKDLANIFFNFGEERYSRRIARAICKTRETSPIKTTAELANLIERTSPKQKFGMPHPAMRTFMAIRIAVNDELLPLGNVLTNITKCLVPGGRIAVITFHSLEDRIVKTTFQKIAFPCICPRDIPYCACGKTPDIRILTKKPILPTQAEITNNKRAHSAKLRIAEKI